MQTIESPLYPQLEPTSKLSASLFSPQASLENTLNNIFPQAIVENNTTRTRRNLGETAKSLSNEEIECIVTEFQFLINSWLDEYERDVFKGLTLREVFNEK